MHRTRELYMTSRALDPQLTAVGDLGCGMGEMEPRCPEGASGARQTPSAPCGCPRG
jgi:hypothetical protein